MAYTVEPSFDYANLKVDYKNKKVEVDYPYRTSILVDWFIFGGIGLFIVTLLTALVGATLDLFNIVVNLFPLWLFFFVGWMIFSFKSKYIRELLIKTGLDERDYNQVYLSSIKSKKVKIKNVHNYFTSYEASGDFSKFIETFEIKCVKFEKTALSYKYAWEIILTFSDIPKKGDMSIWNQVDRGTSFEPNKKVEIEELYDG